MCFVLLLCMILLYILLATHRPRLNGYVGLVFFITLCCPFGQYSHIICYSRVMPLLLADELK